MRASPSPEPSAPPPREPSGQQAALAALRALRSVFEKGTAERPPSAGEALPLLLNLGRADRAALLDLGLLAAGLGEPLGLLGGLCALAGMEKPGGGGPRWIVKERWDAWGAGYGWLEYDWAPVWPEPSGLPEALERGALRAWELLHAEGARRMEEPESRRSIAGLEEILRGAVEGAWLAGSPFLAWGRAQEAVKVRCERQELACGSKRARASPRRRI